MRASHKANGFFSTSSVLAYCLAVAACLLAPAAQAGTATVTGALTAGSGTTRSTNITGPQNGQQTTFTGTSGPWRFILYPFTVSTTGTYTATSTTTHVVNTTWIVNGIFSPNSAALSTPLSAHIVAVLSGNLSNNSATGTFTGFSLTAGQQYSVLVAFNSGSVDGDQSVFSMSGPGCIAIGGAVCESDPIPPFPGLPAITGIKSPLRVLQLSEGKGPTMVNCLAGTVSQLLGGGAAYQGQGANGNARITQGGRIISFYPLTASLSTDQSADIHLGGTNVINIGTNCGNFNVLPALYNPSEFGAALTAAGLGVEVNAQGVMTLAAPDGSVYAALPDYLVTPPGTTSTPGLVLGADGLYRFTDSAGFTQILRPAFVNTDGLYARLSTAFGGGWMVFQTDGTALFTTLGGKQYVATPDVRFTPGTGANAASLFWQDGPNHYQFRTTTLELAQGYTLVPR